jgi:multidrug resistance efflux pump
MNTPRGPHRFFWLLGVALLVGTAAGAGWILNNAPAGTPVPRETPRERMRPGADSIICIGYVDVPLGTTPLYPLQPGRVAEVRVQEGDDVTKGQVLFRMDDRFARTRLAEAEADLKAAEALRAKAEREEKLQPTRIAAQQAAVEAARADAQAQAKAVAALKKLVDAGAGGSPEELAAAREKENAAKKLIELQEAKLKGLKEHTFGPELRLAAANIQAKKAVRDRARLALDECAVRAPADGRALRVFITPDELLGPDPKVPAVQFCPAVARIVRAEVQQEWGNRVEVGQLAVIEDDTRAGLQWTGRVTRVSDWFAPRRSKLQEPFQFNDVRTLECIVAVDPGQPRMRIGQRMRVIIKQGGP